MMDFRDYYDILDDENKKKVQNVIIQKILDQIDVTDFKKMVDNEVNNLMQCIVEDIDFTEVMDAINGKLKERILKVL